MARPQKTVTQTCRPSFRATVAEEEALRKAAAAQKPPLSLSAYLRARVIDQPTGKATPPRQRKAAADVELLARLLGQLGKIGSNLNQMAHQLNAGHRPEEAAIYEGMAALKQIRAAVMGALKVEGQ